MNFRYESKKIREGYAGVIGCDEVGRGCLAGPVVAGAVLLPQVKSEKFKVIRSCRIKDSKLLTAKKRELLAEIIKQNCVACGIGLVEHDVIDKINIHHASLLAMRKAVDDLLKTISTEPRAKRSEAEGRAEKSVINRPLVFGPQAGLRSGWKQKDQKKFILSLDGKFTIPSFAMEQEAVVDGDAKILSIAAASVIAKVYRDGLMREFDKQYPQYNFGRHKGYATKLHCRAIEKFGMTRIHRLSFCGNIKCKI